ncbi:GNAT family N-acetyltransferase [Paenibacillus solani]|uniref:Acetyltransferase n=1 Tax=Paenibacillus solani TaxID=1705565 RepID=A0A0M1N4K8_9BACL|nr:GNAT family protein [Paenibacillus solani]KOR76950.1 acetyltransferase [Paenibacillus solani]
MYVCEGIIPELTGQRIRLRRIKEEDAEAMLCCWSDPDTAAFLDLPPLHSAEDAKSLIIWLQHLAQQDETIRWGIEMVDTGKLIGSCGFNFWQLTGAFRGEFGCELRSAYWGQGYMSEAAELAMTFGYSIMGLNRIEAFVDPRNERACRWFARNGYLREGMLRDYRHTSGGYVDAVVFSRLRREETGGTKTTANE